MEKIQTTEQQPANVKEFAEIANDLAVLYEKKNHDYGNSFHDTFEKFGIISAATRISDKFNRFCQLAKGNEALVQDEKLEDTLRDMASYCIMTLIELKKSCNILTNKHINNNY